MSPKQQLEEDGYVILRNFFSEEQIGNLYLESKQVFQYQFEHFDYIKDSTDFKHNMIRLFNEHEEVFKNCGKLIQTGLYSLYSLANDIHLDGKLMSLGIDHPCMCTRPVLFFNHPKLSKSKEYYMTPTHQDWSSMKASMNSLVVWVPLVDVNEQNGSIIIYPGSHKLGVLPYETEGGFAKVQKPDIKPIQPELKVGDICIFSSLLVHESGEIKDDSIRFSCHFRYTDLLHPEYVERGFENPYQYIPITKVKNEDK